MTDREILLPLAQRVMEEAQSQAMQQKRELWRRHNAFMATPPPIYVRAFAAAEVPEVNIRACQGDIARQVEGMLRELVYRVGLGDDYIIEPWLKLPAVYAYPADNAHRWGPEIRVRRPKEERGAFVFDPPLKEEEDIESLVVPRHAIDEPATREKITRANELIGDVLPVYADRSCFYQIWTADISTDLAYLRGLEQVMWDMYDRPEWLHRLCAFLRDGALKAQQECEDAGDWSLLNHRNQSMCYCLGMEDPQPVFGVPQHMLWGRAAAQEMAQVSPEMWNEFVFEYQKPILLRYGMVSYGCCEDITTRIPYLKTLPNLRRVAVTPWANLRACAQQLGRDYVVSYRPSPAETVATSFDKERVRAILRRDFAVLREEGCAFEINLKDVETVSGNLAAVPGFVQVAREEIGRLSW
nr:hypothetical protein [bacterium]